MDDYKKLKENDVPFKDGLTIEEIEAKWRKSRKGKADVVMLADLCGTTAMRMKKFLIARGWLEQKEKLLGNKVLEKTERESNGRALREMWEKDDTQQMIRCCRELGISKMSGQTLCKKEGIKFRWREKQRDDKKRHIEEIRRLAGEGFTSREIADKLGMRLGTVRAHGYENGIKFVKPPPTSWKRNGGRKKKKAVLPVEKLP